MYLIIASVTPKYLLYFLGWVSLFSSQFIVSSLLLLFSLYLFLYFWKLYLTLFLMLFYFFLMSFMHFPASNAVLILLVSV